MADGFRAEDYRILPTGVTLETNNPRVRTVFDACERMCAENLRMFGDKQVLREGSVYKNVWIETQPMGGEMYASRNMAAALNNQLIFMQYQRRDGRFPGMISCSDGQGVYPFYDWLQGFCFPMPALRMGYLIGKDRRYFELLYTSLKDYDAYLWKYRDSDGDGCLETWCVWDTGEDNCSKYLNYGAKNGCFGGEKAPVGMGNLPHESMEIMAYSYSARDTLSKLSKLLGNGEEEYWRQKALDVRKKVKEYLWDDEKGACYDRDCNNETIPVLSHVNLRCMYFGLFDENMAKRFIKEHFYKEEEFMTPLPLPSIAANDSFYNGGSENNWGGPPQGLTYQRAIDALLNYGYEYEVRLLGLKWINMLSEKQSYVQQYDTYTMEPTKAPEGYGPTMLAALEYIAYMYGVRIVGDEVVFSSIKDDKRYICTQRLGDDVYTLVSSRQGYMKAYLNSELLFEGSRGLRIRTDKQGRIKRIVSIERYPFEAYLFVGGKEYHLHCERNKEAAYL